MLRQLLLFAHVLSAFLYLLAHGASVAVAFRIRRETNVERVSALLDLSRSTMGAAAALMLGTVTFGIALGVLGHWWATRWIWISIITLVALFVAMGRTVAPRFRRIRSAVAALSPDAGPEQRPHAPDAHELTEAIAASASPAAIATFALVGWGVILWMMLFKPF